MPMKRVVRPKSDIETKDGPIRTATELKVKEMAKMLARGKSKDTVKDYIVEKYGLSEARVDDLYYEAIKYLLPKDDAKFKEEIITKNVARLDKIVEETMESKNYKEATKAIAELNKMAGITSNNIKVGMQTDGEGGSTFIVEIG